MGKVSPKERQSKTPKQKRRIRNSSYKYLKPGALAQLRYNKASTAKSCTDLGKKRVAVLDATKTGNDVVLQNNGIHGSPSMLSPERFEFSPVVGAVDIFNKNNLLRTPKTPSAEVFEFESRLESLPMDLLVKILCHLHHDQLRAVFHVSQRIRKAVVIARQFHFNYTTPDRSRQEMLRTMTPLPTEHWPFVSKGNGKGIWISSPHTPKAPRHGPRPPLRLKCPEMRQIAAVLFQESAFPSRCIVPSVLPKPLCKSLASNRVLFYEDELCQAVAQNKLR
ncbi:F-box protein [Camellia lanceoleosa]|uniref:F-box protein n=1 Tax=Camellia lanceoleosa TaxID=1840588 RepID=A0ACC0HUY5_9ERIC|nr:F-box protein [Camellia lanceoleosa]